MVVVDKCTKGEMRVRMGPHELWAFFIGPGDRNRESVHLNIVWKDRSWRRSYKKMADRVDEGESIAIFPSRQSPKRNWHGNRNAGLKDLE